jgi:hypothetical protein
LEGLGRFRKKGPLVAIDIPFNRKESIKVGKKVIKEINSYLQGATKLNRAKSCLPKSMERKQTKIEFELELLPLEVILFADIVSEGGERFSRKIDERGKLLRAPLDIRESLVVSNNIMKKINQYLENAVLKGIFDVKTIRKMGIIVNNDGSFGQKL